MRSHLASALLFLWQGRTLVSVSRVFEECGSVHGDEVDGHCPLPVDCRRADVTHLEALASAEPLTYASGLHEGRRLGRREHLSFCGGVGTSDAGSGRGTVACSGGLLTSGARERALSLGPPTPMACGFVTPSAYDAAAKVAASSACELVTLTAIFEGYDELLQPSHECIEAMGEAERNCFYAFVDQQSHDLLSHENQVARTTIRRQAR